MIENARGRLAGLVVDTLDSQSQAVISPLAKLFHGQPGISGSTILGNGRVALILDVPGLVRHAVMAEPGDRSAPTGAAAR